MFVRVARMWVRSLHVSHGWCFLWRSTQAFHTYLALFQCDMRTDRACAPGLILYVYHTFMSTVYHHIAICLAYECSKNRQEHHLPLPLPRRMVPEIPSPSTHQQRHVPTEPAYRRRPRPRRRTTPRNYPRRMPRVFERGTGTRDQARPRTSSCRLQPPARDS